MDTNVSDINTVGGTVAIVIMLIAMSASIVYVLAGTMLMWRKSTMSNFYIRLHGLVTKTRYVNPDNPVWPDVTDALNLLELIAIAYKHRMLNRSIIVDCYGELYVALFEQVYAISDTPDGETDGPAMLFKQAHVIEVYKIMHRKISDNTGYEWSDPVV